MDGGARSQHSRPLMGSHAGPSTRLELRTQDLCPQPPSLPSPQDVFAGKEGVGPSRRGCGVCSISPNPHAPWDITCHWGGQSQLVEGPKQRERGRMC